MAAQIFIKIDKPFYFAGQTIQGQVYICLYEQIHANQVLLKFKGWEQAKWIEQNEIMLQEQKNRYRSECYHHQILIKMDTSDSSSQQGDQQNSKYNYVQIGHQMKKVQRRKGGRIIVKDINILHNFGGQHIQPGQYVLPFTYKTGEHFPATFKNKALNKKSKGRIKYEMRVFIRGFNSRRRLIKHKTQILIRQSTMIKNQQKQMIANVKSCCCFSKGISKIKCYFDKNAYIPGQNAKIYCIIDNKQCTSNVNKISIKLINYITYISKDNYRKNIQNQIFYYQFPGVPAGGQTQQQKNVQILINSYKSTELAEQNGCIMPTARGERIKCVYYLVVQAVLNASCTCCSDLPKVQQQVVIYPSLNIDYTFHQPHHWAPITMPLIAFSQKSNTLNDKLESMQNQYY